MPELEIRIDDLTDPRIVAFVAGHLSALRALSPPESCHALPVDELRGRGVKFWSVWCGEEVAGCGALQELDPQHGEVKSMRTAHAYLRRGIAAMVLKEILTEARRRGYRRVSLETGSTEEFLPAQQLYLRHGFQFCGPFNGYKEDPLSSFMRLDL